jgi:alpha-D-ribose 1-methylphosphonate 5-triphosphate synthase subunit PhnI
MSRSRAAKPPFTTRTSCWPTGGAATARWQIAEQLALACDRVMAEGSLFDPELAALAIKQARGDLIEAIFLVRAYRTTLPRFGYSKPIDTAKMSLDRRISATFKDLPGGQILGPTFDYTHRLLDFALAAEGLETEAAQVAEDRLDLDVPRVLELLNNEGLIEPAMQMGEVDDAPVGDLTREPLEFPAGSRLASSKPGARR